MVIVVLGHRLESPRIHGRLRARVAAGIRAFRRSEASYLFFTGGRTNPEVDRTECGVMGDYAVRRGVDPDRIVLDPFARDTIGNAYFVRVLMDDLGVDADEITLVTCDFHAPRARYAFEQCFGEGVAIDTGHCVETDVDPHSATRREKLRQTREFFAPVTPGDIEGVRRRLHAQHDYYDFPRAVGSVPR